MKRLKIKEPVWYNHSVGIAESKLKDDLLVDIIYKNSEGNRLYPNTYIIRKGTLSLSRYPTQEVSGYTLRLIPIKDLEVYKVNAEKVNPHLSKKSLEKVNEWLENRKLKGQSEMFKLK